MYVFLLGLHLPLIFKNTKAMKYTMKNVHIGKLIKAELMEQGRSVAWFARKICCAKSNIYKLFERESIDLAQLIKISEVLDHNFLKDCYVEV